MPTLAKRSDKTGMTPGAAIYIGEQLVENVTISVINYDRKQHSVTTVSSIEEAFVHDTTSGINWININGLHEVELLEKLAAHYQIHALALEDILNTQQRPKAEVFDDHIFVVIKMIEYNQQSREVEAEQISMIMGKNYVITFQETEGDIFGPLRQRIAAGKGRLRKMGADYLAYTILDVIVDHYFVVLEALGEELEELDEKAMTTSDEAIIQRLYFLKRELIYVRKSTWPVREIIGSIQRIEHVLIKKQTYPFLADLYDHTLQVIDTVETYRDMTSSIMDIYLTVISNRMNEVMKVLTIMATIFIPLSFLAGVFGMNFDTASPWNLPELGWRYGYIAFWVITLLTGGGLLYFFRRKGWL